MSITVREMGVKIHGCRGTLGFAGVKVKHILLTEHISIASQKKRAEFALCLIISRYVNKHELDIAF